MYPISMWRQWVGAPCFLSVVIESGGRRQKWNWLNDKSHMDVSFTWSWTTRIRQSIKSQSKSQLLHSTEGERESVLLTSRSQPFRIVFDASEWIHFVSAKPRTSSNASVSPLLCDKPYPYDYISVSIFAQFNQTTNEENENKWKQIAKWIGDGA